MMISPFKCRMHARECRTIAHEATTEEVRAEALNMAAIWEDLARDHESAERRVVQQQVQNPRQSPQATIRYGGREGRRHG